MNKGLASLHEQFLFFTEHPEVYTELCSLPPALHLSLIRWLIQVHACQCIQIFINLTVMNEASLPGKKS